MWSRSFSYKVRTSKDIFSSDFSFLFQFCLLSLSANMHNLVSILIWSDKFIMTKRSTVIFWKKKHLQRFCKLWNLLFSHCFHCKIISRWNWLRQKKITIVLICHNYMVWMSSWKKQYSLTGNRNISNLIISLINF